MRGDEKGRFRPSRTGAREPFILLEQGVASEACIYKSSVKNRWREMPLNEGRRTEDKGKDKRSRVFGGD